MSAQVIADPVELEEDLLEELRAVVGDRLSTSAAVREHHGHGEGFPGVFRRVQSSLPIPRKRSARS